MHKRHIAVLAVSFGGIVAAGAPRAGAQAVNWSALDTALGRKGAWNPDSVYKFTFPRVDLPVSKDGVDIRPTLALTSWAAFMPAPGGVMVMGDLVTTELSLRDLTVALRNGGVNPTAVHNHLVGETPHVMYVHFMATGNASQLARAVRTALDAAGLPSPDMSARAQPAFPFDTAGVSAALGRTGRMNGSVYQVAVPRANPVRVGGEVIPPAMGLATAINFQPTPGGKAAITGDFVLVESEVAPVMQVLSAGGVQVTALHNHMAGEEPRIFFMHFWANANAVQLARVMHEALGHMAVR